MQRVGTGRKESGRIPDSILLNNATKLSAYLIFYLTIYGLKETKAAMCTKVLGMIAWMQALTQQVSNKSEVQLRGFQGPAV